MYLIAAHIQTCSSRTLIRANKRDWRAHQSRQRMQQA